jgi:hypothetical protein
MKFIKLIIKILLLWPLISVTSGLLESVFTADDIAFRVFAGVWSIILIIGIILILRSFIPRKKRGFAVFCANNGNQPYTTDQQQWAMYHAEQERKRKRSNMGLFGLFVFMMSIFSFGRTLRNIK